MSHSVGTASQHAMLTSNDNMYLKELDEWQTLSNGFPKSVVIKSSPNWLHLGRQQAYRPGGQQKSAFQICDGLLSYLSGLSRQRLIPSWNGLRLKSNALCWSSCGASSAMPILNNTLL